MLRSAVLVTLLGIVQSELSALDISILRYKALQYDEIENMEHLQYTFDICLCPSNFKGLFPNKSPLCECAPQLKGRKVIESIPQGVYSSSCVYQDKPGKCLNAKFKGQDLGRKIFAKVMIGKTIFTYPTWQTLVYSPYRTTSTLKSAAGSDMRITYTTMLRGVSNSSPSSSTSTVATTSSVPSWRKSQPSSSSIDIETSNRNDLLDILKQNFQKGKSWMMTPIKWLSNVFSTSGTNDKGTSTSSWTTTSSRTTSTTASTPRQTTHNRWDVSDVAHIRNVNDVRNFIVKESATDREDPGKYDIDTVKDELLFYHNVYREMHEAPEVKRSSHLDSLAQRYSDHLAYSKSCLVHEQPRIYGENLFVFGSQHFPNPVTFARAVAQSFYMEGHGYNYNSFVPMSYFKTGHFTQLIWRDSRHIGIGVTVVRTDGRGRGPCFPQGAAAYMIYVCVKYDPAGNYQTSEAYKRNVRPLKRRRAF